MATVIENNVKACAAKLFLLGRGARWFATHRELVQAVERERWASHGKGDPKTPGRGGPG